MSDFGLVVRQDAWVRLCNSIRLFKAVADRTMQAVKAVLCSWQVAVLSVSTYLAIISIVAVYDIQLTIKYALFLKQQEQNPIGRWLMNLDQISVNSMPDITLFLVLKAIGTITVLVVIVSLVRWRARVGHPVGLSVAAFQIGLACYLTYMEAKT